MRFIAMAMVSIMLVSMMACEAQTPAQTPAQSPTQLPTLIPYPTLTPYPTQVVKEVEVEVVKEVVVEVVKEVIVVQTPMPAPVASNSWNDLHDRLWDVDKSVVKVCSKVSGLRNCGTGWVYEDGWVITAAHTLANADVQVEITVSVVDSGGCYFDCGGGTGAGGAWIVAQYMGSDKYRDIAAVKLRDADIRDFNFKPLTMRNIHSLEADEEIVLIGQNEGLDADAKVGVFSKSRTIAFDEEVDGEISVIEFALNTTQDTIILQDDSDGAYVDGQGQVVGIAQGAEPGVQNPGRAVGVPLSEIDKVWDRLKAGERINSDSLTWFDQEFGW